VWSVGREGGEALNEGRGGGQVMVCCLLVERRGPKRAGIFISAVGTCKTTLCLALLLLVCGLLAIREQARGMEKEPKKN
jgi:hypothetical protein